MENQTSPRRPLKSRGTAWASFLVNKLAETSITPNQVSLFSIGFALLGAVFLLLTGHLENSTAKLLFYICAIIGIQGRLLCNLLDGMLAVEKERKSPTGEIFNDLPDRISDLLLLLAAGFSINSEQTIIFSGATLGWLAAAMALMTAYIRLLGASCGTEHFFQGPMAKPHRMAALSAACILSIIEAMQGAVWYVMAAALWIIIIGSIYTCVRRYQAIIKSLESSGEN